MQGVIEGIGIYFSSGDNSDESLVEGYRTTDWPASSPFITDKAFIIRYYLLYCISQVNYLSTSISPRMVLFSEQRIVDSSILPN